VVDVGWRQWTAGNSHLYFLFNAHRRRKENNLKHPSFIAGAALTFAQQFCQIILRLGFVILVARYLGVSANGQIAIIILLVSALNKMLIIGVDHSNIYHISHNLIRPSTCVIMSAALWLISCALAFVFFFVLVFIPGLNLFGDIDETLLWSGIIFFPFSLLHNFIFSILQGQYEITRYNILVISPRIITILLCLLFIYVDNFTPTTALLSWGSGFVATCFLGAAFLARTAFLGNTGLKVTKSHIRDWLSYGLRAYSASLFTFFTQKSDLFLVNYFLGSWSAGIYTIAVQICERLMLLPQSIATVLFPRLGNISSSGKKNLVYVEVLASATFYCAGSLALATLILANPVINILFGAEFEPSIEVIWVLLPGVVAYSVRRILAVQIFSLGRPGLNSLISGVVFIANLCLNLVLIPQIGLIGAAFASSIAQGLSLIAYFSILTRLTNSNIILKIIYSKELVRRTSRILSKYTEK
jgi:O-antigen/teichoic acid export membrane protein